MCQGLAHNIADTLIKGISLPQPVIVVGGVSRNPKVMQYLSELIKSPVVIPEYSALTGAIGCALIAGSRVQERVTPFTATALLKKPTKDKQHFFAPLSSNLSEFPDFTDHTHYVSHKVEVDLYAVSSEDGRIPAYLGFDIGSTSTKAVVIEATQEGAYSLGFIYPNHGPAHHGDTNLIASSQRN